MSFASFFWCSLDVKQTKQTAVDVKHNSHVKHRTVDVDFGFCVQARRGNSLQRCHNTCSDARHQRCLKGKLQVARQLKPLRFSAWPNSFLFRVCVRVETVSVINRLIAPQSHGQSTYTTAEFSWHGMLPWDRYDWSGNGAFA